MCIRDRITSRGGTATAYNEGDDAPASQPSTRIKGKLDWAQYWTALEITGLWKAVSQFAPQLYTLGWLPTELQLKITDLVELINGDLINGTGTDSNGKKTLVGLTHAIDDSNSYGGIDRSLEPLAGSHVNTDASLRNLTLKLMEATVDVHVVSNGGRYDRIYTSVSMARAYAALGDSSLKRDVETDGSQRSMTFIAGYGGMNPLKPYGFFDERPVYGIPQYPANRMDFLWSPAWYIRELTAVNSDPTEVRGVDERVIPNWRGQSALDNPRKSAASLQQIQAAA